MDIFLGSHASFFSLWDKVRERDDTENQTAPFIDPDGYHAYTDRAEERFRRVVAEQWGRL